MKYNLIIDHLQNPRAANIIAHKLAGSLTISIQKAHSMLENMPLVYRRGCTQDEGTFELTQLAKIGVSGHLIAVVPENRGSKSGFSKFLTEHAAAESEMPQKTMPPPVPSVTSTPAVPNPAPPVSNAPDQLRRVSAAYVGSKPVLEKKSFLQRSGSRRIIIVAAVLIGAGLVIVFSGGKNNTLSQMIAQFITRMQDAQVESFKGPAHQNSSGKHAGSGADSLSSASDSARMADSLHVSDSVGQMARAGLTSAQKIESQNYIDSAANSGAAQEERAIYFYRMAIAFNRYNINAWYGLATAYAATGDTAKAEQTRREMEKLFGDRVLLIRELVSSYGTLVDVSLAPSGTYRIEYRSNAATAGQLRLQAWQITRAIAQQCNCAAVSINASTVNTLGSLIYCRLHPLPRTEKEFLANAEIRIFE